MQHITGKTWFAFFCVAFFWGTTFLAIRLALNAFPPFTLAAIRHTIAGTFFLAYFKIRGYAMPNLKQIGSFSIIGILMLTLGNGMVNYSEQYISSGLAALLCTFSPLAILLINRLFGYKEKFTLQLIIGIVLCAIAQFIIFKDNLKDLMDWHYLSGVLAVLVAVVSWGFGSVYTKHHKSDVHPLVGASFQMLAGGIVLWVYSLISGEYKQIHINAEGIYSLLYLIVFGSLIGYGAYNIVLKKMPTSIASTYAYINTLVVVLLGWLILNEKMNLWMMIAVMITIFGLYLINNSRQKS